MNRFNLRHSTDEPDPTADLARSNPPILSTLAYRGGKYQPTIGRMLASLSTQDALARLNRDAYDDWSIALLHAWAIVTDVLGFYQERITNEGYIRTAAERRSVLALAGALGYDWRPGVAASVDLALTVAPDDQDQPQRVVVPKGSAVQSTPGEGQLPQIFETSADAEVRTEWNLLFPFVELAAAEAGASEPLLTDITSMRVANYRSDLQKGDVILFVDQAPAAPAPQPTSPSISRSTIVQRNGSDTLVTAGEGADENSGDPPPPPAAWILGTLTEVVADPQKSYTVIRWNVDDRVGTEIRQPALYVFRQKALLFGYAQGAVYYDVEGIPATPSPNGSTPTDKTTGGGQGTTPTGNRPVGNGQPAVVALPMRATVSQSGGQGNHNPQDGATGGNATNGNVNPGTANGSTGGGDPSTTAPPPPRLAQWTPRTLSLPNLDINAFIVNAKGVIFAGTKRDLFRSLDNGDSWQAVGIDPIGRNVTALALNGDKLFAGSSTGGIYLSYDSGDNWTPVSGDSVAPDVKVTKDAETFKVDPPQILPKAPVLELEFGKDKAGKDVLYALAGQDLFSSGDQGKTWALIDPDQQLPQVQKRPSADEQRAAMLTAAQALLVPPQWKWLERVVAPLAKGAGSAKWWGLDLWDFLRATVRTPPPDGNAVRALAVSTKGKKSTVVVGTDTGKFTLKEKTRRWLVATVIVLLVFLQQFLIHHGNLSTVSVDIAGTGVMEAPLTIDATRSVTATTDLIAQDILSSGSPLIVAQRTTYTLTLIGKGNLSASVDEKKKMLVANGILPLKGWLSAPELPTQNVELPAAFTTFTATVGTTANLTNTIFAMTTTEAADVHLALTATAVVMPATAIWPPVVTLSNVEFKGTVAPAPAVPADPRFPWLTNIWAQVSDLLQTTVIASWNAIKLFVLSLWAALPDWIKNLLTPINDYLIQPVIKFVDTYLIKPLLHYTAATLLQISAIILAVLALLLAWIYADRQMSNRKTVRLTGPVNALAIHPKGQIFAGTEKGVFRSVADDPNAAWWTKVTRVLIRRAFPDVPMEPINTGLTPLETDPPPDIRSLAFTNTGALIAGTADGRIFRLSDPIAELDPNIKPDPNATNGKTDAGAQPVPTSPPDPTTLPVPATPPAPVTPPEPNAKPALLVRWTGYDQGIFLDGKSTLKSVRTLVVTSSGQFVAGGVGAGKVEDRWFTAQVREVSTPDNQKSKIGEIDLDNVYPNLLPGSWLVLRQPTTVMTAQGTPKMKYARYQVLDVMRVRSLDFVTGGEFTRAIVRDDEQLTTFSRTRAEALIQSEAVDLFDNRPVQGATIYLKGYVPHLAPGHRLIINGKRKRALILETMVDALRSDNGLERQTLEKGDILEVLPDPKPVVTCGVAPKPKCDPTETACPWRLRTRDGFIGTVLATKAQIRWVLPAETDPEISEVATVCGMRTINLADEAALQAGLDYAYHRVAITQVNLQRELAYVYDRATVTVFGNIVAATHGQTVTGEVLGSGSGMQANERFMLQERPLTYISVPTARGVDSEIKVEVNGIEWQKEPYLYGLQRDRRAYIVRQDATDNTFIIFGDGKQGARLPTGTEQVNATYRIGIGPIGNVPAYTVDQPQTLPSAVRRSTNPLPATGGVGPDSIEDVRQRAPLSVRILDRIVALSDYEDFVRLYAGIGRVQLKRFGIGQNLLLHFTIADSDGNVVPSELVSNLLKSIDKNRAVATPQLRIDSYEPLYFEITAKLMIYPDHKGRVKQIEQTIRQKLLNAFSFAQREFGRDVAESEVVALLQTVTGVAAVDSVRLTRPGAPKSTGNDSPNDQLTAQLARYENGVLQPAQLLLLNPGIKGIDLKIVTTTEPLTVLNVREDMQKNGHEVLA